VTTDPGQRIRRGIFILAGLLILLLLLLRFIGIDQKLLRVFAISAALLVVVLYMTYRAFAGVAEAARNGTLEQKFGPPPPDDEDDK
jgi:uncharacterized membrane protein